MTLTLRNEELTAWTTMATVRDSTVSYSFLVAIAADFITVFSWLQKLASLFAVHTNIEGIHSS